MKFSIIIPVYNSEKTLSKLVNTILEQTYSDYEIILVDDGSKDNSFKLMKELSKKDTRIKIFTKKNEGPGITRMYGYKQARGELLFFVDSDDWLYDKNVLEKVEKIYSEDEFEILLFNYIRIIKGNKEITNMLKKKNMETKKYKIDELENLLIGGALWGKIFVRDKMKEEFFFDSNNYEDYYTTYMYLNDCNTFNFTDDILYVSNRDNPKSVSKITTVSKQIIALEIIKDIYNNTKFKEGISLLAFNTYGNNWVLLEKLINPSEESEKLLYKLEETKNIIGNLNMKNISIKNKVKYWLTNIAIYIGKRRVK